jgi:acyl-CoA synthetase (NDP forming)
MTLTQPPPSGAGQATASGAGRTDRSPADLAPLFAPRSIAVVGASTSAGKAGGALMAVLAPFPGPIYPVNPRAEEVGGRRAYRAVGEIPHPVDLVMIAVPPAAVPGVIEDCREAGAGAAVICTGGFAEAGDAGAALQEEIAAAAREAGIRLLGPNTSGFLAPSRQLYATFMPAVHDIRPGSLAIVAQSGGVNLAATFMAARRGCGVSLAVGLGNAVDVGFAEILDYLADDAATTAVALHVEGVADGRALMAAVRRVSARKPVIGFKVGRSDVSDFAKSHTGALAGSWSVARAGLEQAGAVVVDSLTDLVDAASALTVTRLPPAAQVGIGVVTGQAGPGLIITDALSSAGAAIPPLSDRTRSRLTELLPPLTYQRNPVDTGRPGPTFLDVMQTVGQDAAVDALLVYALQEHGNGRIVANLCDPAWRARLPPVVMATGGPESVVAEQRDALHAAGVVTADSPDRAAFVMAALVADARARERVARPADGAAHGPAAARIPGAGLLDEHAGKDLLDGIGLTTPRRRICGSVDDASQVLAGMATPVVVKVLDANVTHKSAAGGVRVGVTTVAELRAALTATAVAATGSGSRWLVEEQAPPGTELIVGGLRDAAFGPAVIVGAGGTAVEWATPPVVRAAPLSHADAVEAVELLNPALLAVLTPALRGELATVLAAVSRFMARHPEVLELDINPLRATATGLIALDAVVRLAPPPGAHRIDPKDPS